jgi:hypothetical protein
MRKNLGLNAEEFGVFNAEEFGVKYEYLQRYSYFAIIRVYATKARIMKNDALVVKHNSLIRSRYDYTLAELRLVIAIASMIEVTDEDFREYRLSAKEFSELVDSKHKDEYGRLRELGEGLLSKPLKIPRPANGFLICNWLSSYEYIPKKGHIVCSFDPKLKPYLLQLKEQFTKYQLENILKFKSAYSIRLYELAKSWEARGDFTISLDELRDILGIGNKYKLYNDLKRYVLQRSIKEINALSDIKLSFKEKKVGRKVTDLVFQVKPKETEARNWMASLRAFIAHIRKAYRPDPDRNFFPPVLTGTQYGDLKVDKDGKIYFTGEKTGLFELDFSQADTIWKWLYESVKEGRVTLEPEPTYEAG